MPTVIEYWAEDQLRSGILLEKDNKRITLEDTRGRQQRISPDKQLFAHQAASIEALSQSIDTLKASVDIPFLWEILMAEGQSQPMGADELSRLFFNEQSMLHRS